MTREEIMADEYSKLIMNWEKAYKSQPLIFQAAHEAMSKFAKQRAISFAEWLSDHRLDFQPSSENGCWIGVDMKVVSSSELYHEFINNTSK